MLYLQENKQNLLSSIPLSDLKKLPSDAFSSYRLFSHSLLEQADSDAYKENKENVPFQKRLTTHLQSITHENFPSSITENPPAFLTKIAEENFDFCNEDNFNTEINEEIKDIISRIKNLITDQNYLPVYEVKRENDRIQFEISSSEEKRVIYCLVNTVSQKCLVGETGSSLKGRFSAYKNQFNDPDYNPSSEKKRQLLSDIRANPQHFKLMVIERVPLCLDIGAQEQYWIQQIQSITSVYNDNKGGGGGRAHSEEEEFSYAIPLQGPLTPKKNYRIGVHVKSEIPKTFDQEIENETPIQFYRFKNLNNPSQIYVGLSGNVKKRVKQHLRNASVKSTLLGKALKTKSNRMVVGVYPVFNGQKIPAKDKEKFLFFNSARKVEAFFIKRKKASTRGLNINRGGGGSLPRSACRKNFLLKNKINLKNKK